MGMSKTDYDLCVIGGGVNGTGIARDAAMRGLSVLLVEAKDLAQATSSASTKLIHGGLRYLEFYEFKLVRESLKEREALLKIAPHIIWPLQFILPHSAQQRPRWMIRLGLFLYDHLAKRNLLDGSKAVKLVGTTLGVPIDDRYTQGFSYTDCWVDDSRLTVLNAVDAAEKGAKIMTRTACQKLVPHRDHWEIKIQSEGEDKTHSVSASMVVNAAGPWVRKLLEQSGLDQGFKPVPNVRLVKGSHIIIPKAFEGDQAYILQQKDGRIVFFLPYEGKYTLIGTTEETYDGDLYAPRISDAELQYLIDAHNTHMKNDISADDVLWAYSGVRPLFDDGDSDNRKVTRDFVLHQHLESRAPMISVFGGKLTTYRVLSEQVVNKLTGTHNCKTAEAALPGGEFDPQQFEALVEEYQQQYSWLPSILIRRYARAYGTRIDRFLRGAKTAEDLGRHFGDYVFEAEIVYLIKYEFAREAEDIFFRRSKLGLHVSEETMKAVEDALPKLKKELLG